MAEAQEEKIELRVSEALKNDVGRGVVRLDTVTRDTLNVSAGDIVEIFGKKSTGAIVWRAYAEDENMGMIRMDGILRQNAGVSLGDKVIVKKAKINEAVKVVISPLQPIKFTTGFGEFINRRLLGRPIIKGDKVVVAVLGNSLPFIIEQTQPTGLLQITATTKIIVKEKPSEGEKGAIPSVAYEDIGGLRDEIARIREMIELPLKHPELFERLGIEPPKGVLLHGPPGTGKTLIAKAVANETNAYFLPLNGPEIMSKFYGESEENLRKVFKEAEENAPSIIFIDEIDAIAPKREEVTGEVERRVVAQLLALMDGLKKRGKIIVIGATNRPNAIDPALRRPGRFDREIEIGIPDAKGRLEILQIHTRGMPLANDVDLKAMAASTHGFVGADMEALCKEAAMSTLRRILPKINLEEESIPPEVLEELQVKKEDFNDALKLVEPSALREVFVEIPNVKWEDIGGLEGIKQELKEVVEWPMKYPDEYEKFGITPSRGILLFGPPGTGKTLLAQAVANESEANFISIKGPEILSKWVGESERAVREIFRKAKQASPCIIFFDEIDAVASRRGLEEGSARVGERIVNQLLTEMDGLEELHGVVVIGATNRPDLLDAGLLRPGRLDRLLYVPVPDRKARVQIFKIHSKGMPLAKEVDLEKIADETENYVGADIEAICREAGMEALREVLAGKKQKRLVTMEHFQRAAKRIKPSISEEMQKFYEGMIKKYESRAIVEELIYLH